MIFEKNFLTDQHIIRLPYMQDNLIAIVPPSHPLATLHYVSLQQLKNERLCLIKEGSLMYQIAMDACQNANFVPNIVFTSHRIDSILDMVVSQNCVALLMDAHITQQSAISWCALPIVPVISSQCYSATAVIERSPKQLSFLLILQHKTFSIQLNQHSQGEKRVSCTISCSSCVIVSTTN